MPEVALELLDDPVWQMSRGERAAVQGILSALQPKLAVEIGSMEGACLRWIARHAAEVHSFDLQPPTVEQPDNVRLHTGDSHELLPAFLAELAEASRNVDFVMVDGDHSPEGVRQDLEDLLDSPAVRETIILIHDIANERVREGVDSVPFTAWPKVSHVELDWIPGQLFAEPGLRNELWYGLGLVVVGGERPARHPVYEQRYHRVGPLLAELRRTIVLRESVPQAVDSPAEAIGVLQRWVRELDHEISLCRDREALLDGELDRLRRREDELVARLSATSEERDRIGGIADELRAVLQATEEQLRASQARSERAERELEEMTISWERASRALEDVKSSVSWKATKPLRGIKRGVRGAD